MGAAKSPLLAPTGQARSAAARLEQTRQPADDDMEAYLQAASCEAQMVGMLLSNNSNSSANNSSRRVSDHVGSGAGPGQQQQQQGREELHLLNAVVRHCLFEAV